MKLAVVVCGRIGSGKSTAVDFVAAEFGFKAVSFGGYVRHLAALRGMPRTRGQLQDLGDSLFKSKGSSGLLQAALEHYGVNSDDSVVFDGVRHPEILADIRQAAEATIAVYLEANQEDRFRRHQVRQCYGWALEEFLVADQHLVEAGNSKLIEQCDIVLDAALSNALYDLYQFDVEKRLNEFKAQALEEFRKTGGIMRDEIWSVLFDVWWKKILAALLYIAAVAAPLVAVLIYLLQETN